MKSMELLEAMGNIRDRYIVDAHQPAQTKRVRLTPSRLLLIAAILAAMLVLVGCTAVLLGLADLSIGKKNVDMGFQQTRPLEILSLQGYRDSKQYQAAKEWDAFLDTYDQDGALMDQADRLHYAAPIEYMAYLCYTPEMKDKIDSICETYDLDLLGPIYFARHANAMLWENLGIDTFCTDGSASVDLQSGYCYQDGSFSLSGAASLRQNQELWPHEMNFQYFCNQKSSFHSLFLAVEELDAFQQWEYTTQDGTTVLLALSSDKALILADTSQHFTSVSILNPFVDLEGSRQVMDRLDLEAVADAFVYAYTPVWQDSDNLEKAQWVLSAMPEGEENPVDTLEFYSADYEKNMTVLEFRSLFGNGEVVLDIPKYTKLDLDGNGTEEILLWLRVNQINDYGVLVLHQEGESLRGDSFVYRQMYEIKEDGTFWSSGETDGPSRLQFENGVPVIQSIPDEGQMEKPDAAWTDNFGESLS